MKDDRDITRWSWHDSNESKILEKDKKRITKDHSNAFMYRHQHNWHEEKWGKNNMKTNNEVMFNHTMIFDRREEEDIHQEVIQRIWMKSLFNSFVSLSSCNPSYSVARLTEVDSVLLCIWLNFSCK